MEGVFLENQSWVGVKEYLKQSNTIIIPIGSIENEGEHLPLGLDTHVAMYLSKAISKRTGCMVGPCLSIGYSKWFMNFCGTISLQHDTLTTFIQEYCNCLYEHGFKKFIFLNPHRGNGAAIADVGREIRKKRGLVTMIDIWRVFEQIVKSIDSMKDLSFSHGGDIMTSVALAIYPEYVDMQNAQKTEAISPLSKNILPLDTVGLSKFKGNSIFTYTYSEEVTSTGSLGDPTNSTKEKGNLLLGEMISFLEDLVIEVRALKINFVDKDILEE